jgi:hypothetical protein
MNAFIIAVIFLLAALGATLAGFYLRSRLPEHHVSEHSRGVIVLSTKLVATMTALLLGLLVSSANDALQTFNGGLEKMGARLAVLDRVLGAYGPETREARHMLREHLVLTIGVGWPEERRRLEGYQLPPELAAADSFPAAMAIDPANPVRALAAGAFLARLENEILGLAPQDATQRWRQTEALSLVGRIAEDHWLLAEKVQDAMPRTLLVLLLAWLMILFTTFGLFAPRNATVTTVFVLCAFSAAAAVFVILEMNSVTSGMMKASVEPLIKALRVIGR